MVERKMNRLAQGLAAILMVVLLGGIVMPCFWLRCYWVAKYRGEWANLRGAFLIRAPLAGIILHGANLERADLREADLHGAYLNYATLDRGRLDGANLRGATVWRCSLQGADLTNAMLAGARYSRHTCWPGGFNPRRHGAVPVNIDEPDE
jgi:hypothetical protein